MLSEEEKAEIARIREELVKSLADHGVIDEGHDLGEIINDEEE